MIAIFFVILILVTIYGPQIWAKFILEKYNKEEYFSGTGFDFANILVDSAGLTNVKVETTEIGDHYDPIDKVVRLNPATYNRRSLTAVVIAAHEVGHAIQDQTEYLPLSLRTRLVTIASKIERIGAASLVLIPIITLLTRIPALGIIMLGAGAASIIAPVIVHLFTLPVELDASFKRALPILATGEYIPPEDQDAARNILTACALTYVAGALSSLLNVWRWLRILRR